MAGLTLSHCIPFTHADPVENRNCGNKTRCLCQNDRPQRKNFSHPNSCLLCAVGVTTRCYLATAPVVHKQFIFEGMELDVGMGGNTHCICCLS